MDFCKTPCRKSLVPHCLPLVTHLLLLSHTENRLMPQSFKTKTENCFCLIHFSFPNTEVCKKENKILNSSQVWDQITRKALHIQKSHRKAPRHWTTSSSHFYGALGWSEHCWLTECSPSWGRMGIRGQVSPLCSSEAFPALWALPDPPAGAAPPTHGSALWDPTSAPASLQLTF